MNWVKLIGKGVVWLLSLCMFLCALVSIPSAACVLFVIGGLLILPVRPLWDFLRRKGLKSGLSVALAFALFIGGIMVRPAHESTKNDDDTPEPPSQEASTQPDAESNESDPVDIKTAYDNDIVVAAKLTLDRFTSGYKMSLAPQKWTIADFDDDSAIMATTDITLSGGEAGKAIFVLTPIFEDGEMIGATPHYVSAVDTVYIDDGYCDEFFQNIGEIAAAFGG